MTEQQVKSEFSHGSVRVESINRQNSKSRVRVKVRLPGRRLWTFFVLEAETDRSCVDQLSDKMIQEQQYDPSVEEPGVVALQILDMRFRWQRSGYDFILNVEKMKNQDRYMASVFLIPVSTSGFSVTHTFRSTSAHAAARTAAESTRPRLREPRIPAHEKREAWHEFLGSHAHDYDYLDSL